ncbi:hypothetical protein [Mucilaginibacter sp.]|uniref:hypothetical protein n=1 Tax=Mucilaginibacter sp. TaxID=1882438 RepID=UPI002ED46271
MARIFTQPQIFWLRWKYAPIILISYCFIFFSCNQLGDKKPAAVYPHKNKTPEITPIPFGPKVDLDKLPIAGMFYTGLIYKDVGQIIKEGWTAKTLKNITVYPLPPIKSVKYIQVSSIDTEKCDNGLPRERFLKLNRYRYRLPNIGKYECYYICDYAPASKEYTANAQKYCQNCLFNMFYGYLIIYNPKNYEASVITIFYDTFRDGADLSRHFYIDRNYNIYLVDFEQEADDGDGTIASPVFVNNKYYVSISSNGKIVCTKAR